MAHEEPHILYQEKRGCMENSGMRFRHEHPVVRTNPVTGWKSIYALGQNTEAIKDMTPEESKMILNWIIDILYKNHDTTARIRWNNRNDLGKYLTNRYVILSSANLYHSYLGQSKCFPLRHMGLRSSWPAYG